MRPPAKVGAALEGNIGGRRVSPLTSLHRVGLIRKKRTVLYCAAVGRIRGNIWTQLSTGGQAVLTAGAAVVVSYISERETRRLDQPVN